MKILISSTDYSIIIDTSETTLEEWMICLEQQYPLIREHSFWDDWEKTQPTKERKR